MGGADTQSAPLIPLSSRGQALTLLPKGKGTVESRADELFDIDESRRVIYEQVTHFVRQDTGA